MLPIIVFLIIVVVIPLAIKITKKAKAESAPCSHGVKGACEECAKEAERQKRCQDNTVKWERIRREEIKRLSQARLHSFEEYLTMEPKAFEDAIAEAFRKVGFKVSQTSYTRDGGKDAIGWFDGSKAVIECKRYGARSVTGRRDLQILLAAKHDESADIAIFVSTGRFSADALAYARENDIIVCDKNTLPDFINAAYGAKESLAYAKTVCLDCGKERKVRLKSTGISAAKCSNDPKHNLHTTITPDHLKYPNLDLDAPWCPTDQVPMRRVSGRRGLFWGCPKYPDCRATGGSAELSPAATAAKAEAWKKRRPERIEIYNNMDQTLRDKCRRQIETNDLMREFFKRADPEAQAVVIANRYVNGE